jgi:hypothetical protein
MDGAIGLVLVGEDDDGGDDQREEGDDRAEDAEWAGEGRSARAWDGTQLVLLRMETEGTDV